jgi:CheY-like chemotaxis protein
LQTVLLVDDNKSIREFCRRELEMIGYRVAVAADGEEALSICQSVPPDVVVLDVRMPGMSGIDLIRVLSERRVLIPVILHSAQKLEMDFAGIGRQVRAYLQKSPDLSELKSTIARVLGDRGPRESNQP